jgi:hypothetical protein
MGRYKGNINKLLADAQLALANGRNIPEIFEVLSQYGYDNIRFDQGLQLYEQAHQLSSGQVMAFSEQQVVHEDLVAARGRTQSLYNAHRAFVRLALRGDQERRAALGAGGYYQQSFSAWIGQVNTFYTHLLEDAHTLQKLASYNVGVQQIEPAREALRQTIELNRLHKQRRTEARASTRARDDALFALRAWLNEFRTVARIAFAQTSESLVALGFK